MITPLFEPEITPEKKLFYTDLHTHTIYSDGSSTAAQNVIDMAMIGIQVMAITDHDNTRGYWEAREEAKKWGALVIPGVEITTDGYHILGYGLDVNNKKLEEILAHNRENQEYSARQKVDAIQKLGVPMTFEKIKMAFPYSRLGKTNFIATMMTDPECRMFHGYKGMQELYNTYFSKSRGAPLANLEGKKDITSLEAISAIHSAGGIAVLAHPFKDVDYMPELDKLVKEGIDGIEIQPNYGDRNKPYQEYAEKNKLLMTYGSDYHGARKKSRPLLHLDENRIPEFWQSARIN